MINHVRTLIMNRDREGFGIDQFGEEYIETDFIPKQLTPDIQAIHRVLFGGMPDRLFVSYRMRQLLTMMHSTPLAGDILFDDSRITYLPFKDDLFEDAFNIEYIVSGTVSGPIPIRNRVQIIGTHEADIQSGILEQVWDVKGQDISTEPIAIDQVHVTKRRQPFATEIVTLVAGEAVPLIGSGLSVLLHDIGPTLSLTVVSRARPTLDIAPTLQTLQNAVGEAGLGDLFALPMPPEPYRTWHAIYRDDVQPYAMRLTALLLAMATRTDSLPQASA